MGITGMRIHGSYDTARTIAEISAVFGWIMGGIGVLVTIIGLGNAPFGLAAVPMGIGLVALGSLQVAAGQMLRATVDSADYARQSFILQLATAEGRHEIHLGGAIPAQSSPGLQQTVAGPQPLSATQSPRVINEGVLKGRRWRQIEDGSFDCELATGEFKKFTSLEEFERYIG